MLKYMRAVCYSGYRRGQSPQKKIYPTYEQVKEDLLILDKEFDIIRMYEPCEHSIMALKIIREEELHLKMMLGLDHYPEYNNINCPWIDQSYSPDQLEANAAYNDRKLEELIQLAKEYKDIIIYLSAGHQNRPFWGYNLLTEARIVYFIKTLKASCIQKVTYCDDSTLWSNRLIPAIAQEVDFISAHIYPLWDRIPTEDAVEYTTKVVWKIGASWGDKEVAVTETGWTTDTTGEWPLVKKDATVDSQKVYVDGITKWAKDNDKLVFYFEAFDEGWKGTDIEEEPEKHWGLWNEDRKRKSSL